MPNTPMTRSQGRGVVRTVFIGLAVLMGVLAYVLYQSYEGRVDLIKAERQACREFNTDRSQNALGWRTAQRARLETLARNRHISYKEATALLKLPRKPNDPPDLTAAWQYNKIASGLETRAKIPCESAIPNTSLLP